jgi:hypothetical protein
MQVLPALRLDTCTRDDVFSYFRNGWEITEALFSSLADDSIFAVAPDSLRQPLIFYFCHPAVFYVNKMIEAGIIQQEDRIEPNFESIFAIGVDEMSCIFFFFFFFNLMFVHFLFFFFLFFLKKKNM